MNDPSPVRRRVLLGVSHLLALLLGLLLFRSFSPAAASAAVAESTGKSPATETTDPTASPAAKDKRTRSETSSKTSVHRIAWKLLAAEGLTRPERMKASAEILEGWIRDDWQAALDTVMKEPPDDFALLEEFHEFFVREPDAVWKLIEEKRYGVLSATLRGHWQAALGECDEAVIRQVAATLPEPGRQAALEAIGPGGRR